MTHTTYILVDALDFSFSAVVGVRRGRPKQNILAFFSGLNKAFYLKLKLNSTGPSCFFLRCTYTIPGMYFTYRKVCPTP